VAKCLSFHASYECRRSGACCSAGWSIPFNAGEQSLVQTLSVVRGAIASTPDGAFAQQEDGRCTFLLSRGGDHACAIHKAGGHAALPLTCRMFPRQVLHDPRGTFISLSHFCPTAAGLLFDDDEGSIGIMDAPAALAGDGMLDGLDARETWPPLLRPGVMMDHHSFSSWERHAIELLTRSGVAPRTAIAALHDATERLQSWAPDSTVPLERAVDEAFAVPVGPSPALAPHDVAVKRWLAARLFGSWIAYQGDALRTLVRFLSACHDVFVVELARDGNAFQAIRRSDRLIVHESASQRIATLLNDRS
jgi:Fe-S-cluster containining protein